MKIKRILIPLTLITLSLTGCSNTSKVTKDIDTQIEQIKTGQEDLTEFDLFERMNVSDSKINVEDLTKANIFGSVEYNIKDLSVNKSTAIANIEFKVKDVDTILSSDTVISSLLLKYDDFVSKNPSADRSEIDKYLLDEVCSIINNSNQYTTNVVTTNIFYSNDTKTWRISYDDDFLDCLLGNMEKDYNINLDDICDEEKKEVNISYDNSKILNLPDSNKTTRSNLKNPVSVNEEAYFDNSDYFFSKQRYELKIKLTDIVRGTEAENIVKNASPDNNKTLGINEEYILFKVWVKLENNLSESKDISISTNDFSLLGEDGHYYNNAIIFGLDEIQPLEEGESSEGYVCFTIDKNVKPYLLFKDYMDNTICFSY